MNRRDYIKALKAPEWKEKRQIILKRDNYKCVVCNCKDNLHVHHKYYLEGKMPWEVPDDCLVTLCKTCHEKEHEGKNIQTFIRRKKVPRKNKKEKTYDLLKTDRELQKRYDEIRMKGKLPPPTYKPIKPIGKKQKKSKRKKK